VTTFAVLATGPSMNQELADYVKGKCSVVAVCNAYELAVWADAVVCNDANWWNVHVDAHYCAGRRFSSSGVHRTEKLGFTAEFPPGTNSGLQGMRVARLMGATRILLLGFDMHGTHYFGQNPASFSNTTESRFAEFIRQFDAWRGPEVINCTPGSALTRFPFATIEEILK
jgi:hypothetical protein